MSVRKRKLGKENVFDIPANINANDGEYDVQKDRDGIISYIPHRKNPFHDPKIIKNNKFQPTEDIRGGLIGKEIFWDE